MRVFVSYSSQDKLDCEEICKRLDKAGMRVVTDEQLKAGSKLTDSIRADLARSNALLLIATENSLKSDWCKFELGAFWGSRKPFIVFQKDNKLHAEQQPGIMSDTIIADSIDDVVSSLHSLQKGKNFFTWGCISVVFVAIALSFVFYNCIIDLVYDVVSSGFYRMRYGRNEQIDVVTDDSYQDFKNFTSSTPVSFLWSDSRTGSRIWAELHSTEELPFLRIFFMNQAAPQVTSALPSNVAVATKNTRPLLIEDRYSSIGFDVRYPPAVEVYQEFQECKDYSGKDTVIAVRLMDRKMSYWEYSSRSGEYIPLNVDSDNWKFVNVPLVGSEKWHPFDVDGNSRYIGNKPDFSVVFNLVLELGKKLLGGRPGPGCGVIDIRDVRFQKRA